MKISAVAISLCFLLCGCVAKAEPRDLRSALDAQLSENAERYGIPAQAVLVMHKGEILYRNQKGFSNVEARQAVRADDVYGVYSVSKLFVSALIFQLVDQGRLKLDDTAGRYVANLPPAWRALRIEQLLNHTTGLPDFFDGPDVPSAFPPTRDELFGVLGDRPFYFEPDTGVRYTQTNYILLQAVLEAAYGAPYREIVRTRITEPLGLRDVHLGYANAPAERLVTAYVGMDGRLTRDRIIPWQDYSISHAELFTTPDDLGLFLTAVAQGRFARQETLLRLWRPYRLTNGDANGFASGWDNGEVAGWRDVGHDGGVKVRVRLLFRGENLDDNYVIVYLTNGMRDNVWTRTLVESVQSIILADRGDR